LRNRKTKEKPQPTQTPQLPVRLTSFACGEGPKAARTTQGVPATEYPTGENIARPGHRTQIGDHDWVVPISKEWAKVLKVSQSTANGTRVTTKPKHTTHSSKTNLYPFDSLRSLRAFRPQWKADFRESENAHDQHKHPIHHNVPKVPKVKKVFLLNKNPKT
jgi:hypothetical protein